MLYNTISQEELIEIALFNAEEKGVEKGIEKGFEIGIAISIIILVGVLKKFLEHLKRFGIVFVNVKALRIPH